MKHDTANDTLYQVINSLPQGVIIYDNIFKAVKCNPAAEKILGVTASEIIGGHVFSPAWQVYSKGLAGLTPEDSPIFKAFSDGQAVYDQVMGFHNPARQKTCWINLHAIPLFIPGENHPFQVYVSFDDITDRSRAEELFDKAFMENPCAMSISQLESGLYIEVNNALKQILGFSREDMIGKTTDEVKIYRYPEERSKVVEAIKTSGRASNMELEFLSKDGQPKTGLFNAELIELGGEKVLLSAVLDITEQRLAEADIRQKAEQLALNERRLNSLLEAWQYPAQDINELQDYGLQKATSLTESSVGFMLVFDRSLEDFMLDIICYAGIDQATQQQIEAELNCGWLFKQAASSEHPLIINDVSRIEGGIDYKPGQPPSVIRRFLSIPVWTNNRKLAVVGVANKADAYVQDDLKQLNLLVSGLWEIVQRRQVESRNTMLQQMMKDIFDHMPSFLCSIDSQGHITQWNRQAENDTGIPRAEAMRRPLSSVIACWPEVGEIVEQCLAQGVIVHKELEIPGNDTARWYAEIAAYPLSTGTERGAVLRIDDVSERKRLLDVLIQTEKMLSIGGIAAGMAHEINNPLGGILQGIQNIYRRFDPEMPRNVESAEEIGIDLQKLHTYMDKRGILQFIDGIRESGERAAQIVLNMLQFSRNAAHHKECQDIACMLENVLNLAAADHDINTGYDFRHIELVKEFSPHLEPIPCNRTEIEQVVLNLLTNAAQALGTAPDNSRINRPQITLRAYPLDNWAIIEVEDNGPGMPEETARLVFEPFFTTKPPGEGTGLGLSVSYFIIANNHKGEIQVRSAPGQGTCFIIRLPYDAA